MKRRERETCSDAWLDLGKVPTSFEFLQHRYAISQALIA
jgi:hypothetical protein